MTYFLCQQLAYLLFRCFCRVHLITLEEPPQQGSLILACNHISHFDPPLLSAFFRRPLTWVAMEELFSPPWAAHFFSWLGVIPVDRLGKKSLSNRHSLKAMKTALANKKVLGLFPEGGIRSGTASILEGGPIKPGLASLSASTKTPIIPCVILGTDRLYSSKAWCHRPPLWIIMGKQIPPPVLPEKGRASALHLFEKEVSSVFPLLQQELYHHFQLKHDDLPKTAQERRRKP